MYETTPRSGVETESAEKSGVGTPGVETASVEAGEIGTRSDRAGEVAGMSAPGRVAFALVLIVGVVGPGLANYFLAQSGYETLGTVVWALGYATMVFVLWYVWVRPLDLSGPTGEGGGPER